MSAQVQHQPGANTRLLTGKGGSVELAAEQQRFMALFSDGSFWVSQTHLNDHQVASIEARARRLLGIPINKYPTDMQTIQGFYQTVAPAVRSTINTATTNTVTDLVHEAQKARASDIHIRVVRDKTELWFRIHGDMTRRPGWDRDLGLDICRSIYQYMADVKEKSYLPAKPQDARIAYADWLPKSVYGIRIGTTPTDTGNLMVLRLLYDEISDDGSIETLGYSDKQIRLLNYIKARPNGMLIVSGPTGSGKSTTLQRILRQLLRELDYRINLITIEDPCEYPIEGAVQIPVTNAKDEEERKQAFARTVAAALRLDPDRLMVGEIRDAATADVTYQGALTGHQVWTTLHANDAFECFPRLVNLGLDWQMLGSTSAIAGLVAQRLVKTLCPACKTPIHHAISHREITDKEFLARLESRFDIGPNSPVYVRGKGCPTCEYLGLKGRTVAAQVVATDDDMMEFIRQGDVTGAKAYWREAQGGQTMIDHAIEKISAGMVDPQAAELVVGHINHDLLIKNG